MDLTSDHPFWTVKNGILADYPPLPSDQSCDIVIIGAGITGSLIAEALTADGHDVIVLDGRDFGRGSTSASTALLQYEIDTHLIDLIRMHDRKTAELAYRACHASIDFLEARIRDLKIDCGFTRKDSVYLASSEDDVEILRAECQERKRIGIDVHEWSPMEIATRFGFHRPLALHSTQAAEVDSYRLTNGMLRAAHERGAKIFDRTSVTKIENDGTTIRLFTDRDSIVRAKRVIVATGYETSELFDTRRFVNLNSSFAIATDPIPPEHFWWKRCLLWETRRPYFYLRTTEDGRAIFGGEDLPFKNASSRDKLIPAKASKLFSRFTSMFPGIPTETAYSWAGTFGETKDGLAFIGELPEYPNCHFALGFGGNGITYSMIAAEIIRDTLKGRTNGFQSAFRFDR